MNILRSIFLVLAFAIATAISANPVSALLERIDRGASSHFKLSVVPSDKDYFELEQSGDRIAIRGNTWVNVAVGVNWYLKHYAGIHLTWNQMHTRLPKALPAVPARERHETDLTLRYDFNYCTFSYSMAFWDWNRWQEEIDWMALHGINMPLAAVGHECVWRNIMLRMGYSEEQIGRFIAGPAFLAWWEMNNLEGWGGPLPPNWYKQQETLQRQILRRMKEFGMKPVLPGYSGMCPSNALQQEMAADITAAQTSSGESNQSSLQLWNGFTRPGVIMPGDPEFDKYARLFYEETRRLYGKADYYSIDPFHEASNLPEDLDIGEAGRKILDAMKSNCGEHTTWVVQGWSENPRPEMLSALPNGDVLVLDLFSECRPQWGSDRSIWHRDGGYGEHDWCFCLLENFGANVGMHGRIDQLLDNYYEARQSFSAHMRGIGLTMEGLGTNPVMYELMCELPWHNERMTREKWMKQYAKMRYGAENETMHKAWTILGEGIYNCPWGNNQQGPHESVFCSRPSLECFQSSSWSKMQNYYDPTSTLEAARLMLSQAECFGGNDNYEYDLVDTWRQAIADEGRRAYNWMVADFKCFDRKAFDRHAAYFLSLIDAQDRLLSTRREFMVGSWIKDARNLGKSQAEADLYEWNARVQVTTWGNRYCADTGGLRDYAHKEWSGLLKDYYRVRWVKYIETLRAELNGELPVLPVGNSSTPTAGNPAVSIDWYAIEEPWTLQHNTYPYAPQNDPVVIIKDIDKNVIGKLQ